MTKRTRVDEYVLFGNKENCDLIVTSREGSFFYLHAIMLQVQSGVFRDLEWNSKMTVSFDHSTEACHLFFKLLYENWVPNLLVGVEISLLLQVWKIAFQYDVSHYCECIADELELNLKSQSVEELIEIANTASFVKSESTMLRLFSYLLQPGVLTLLQLQNLDTRFKDFYLMEHLKCDKIQQEIELQNELREITNESFEFFGPKEECDLIVTNLQNCTFYVHRILVLLASKNTNITSEKMQIWNYSTHAIKLFFELLYRRTIPDNTPLRELFELIKILRDFKVESHLENLENLFDKQIINCSDIAFLIQITNEIVNENTRKMLFDKLMQPKLLSKSQFLQLGTNFKDTFLVSLLKIPDFKIGDLFEVQDHENKWYYATVKDISFSAVLFHFEGWAENNDKWIPKNSKSICAIGTRKIKSQQQRVYVHGIETRTLLQDF
jgi:hypothetical protein